MPPDATPVLLLLPKLNNVLMLPNPGPLIVTWCGVDGTSAAWVADITNRPAVANNHFNKPTSLVFIFISPSDFTSRNFCSTLNTL